MTVRTNENMFTGVKTSNDVKSFAERMTAPIEAGIKRQNEKLKASVVERPNIKATEMVEPARETPGRIATAWASPISRAFL